ncbi:MAG TPA: hypothetical protein VED63_00045, partial [Acidimicrobiales bacterium]|nr:hypothetical protein [Acidimicrobiales bacterium]
LEARSRGDYLFDHFRAVTTSGSSGRRGVYVYSWDEWTTLALIASRGRLGTIGDLPRPPGSSTASLFGTDETHLSRAMHVFLADPGDPIRHFPMTLPVSELVQGLNAVQPDLLMAYPSALELLLCEVHAGRLRISPRHIETGGELLLESTRAAVRDAWDVEIDDCWALCEGVYAYPCRFGRAMHLPDDLIIIEPVDLAGRPVPAGEPAAKLYLTNLYNFTEPLIRFEVADGLTLLDESCPCGSAHRRIADLSGRSDMVFEYDRDVRVYPMLFTLDFHDYRSVAEFQVRQTEQGVAIAVVTDRPEGLAKIRDRAVNTLLTAGLLDPEVTVESVQRLERLDSGKLRQFVPLARTKQVVRGD